jgi:hypothetical protein
MPTFSDLTHTSGSDNMPGLAQRAFFAFVADIATFPTVAATPANAEGRVRLTGSYVMESGKKFYECYTTKNKGNAKSEPQGELDCITFKNTGKLFFPHTTENARAAAADLKNASVVVIFLEPDGSRIVFGSKNNPASVKPMVNYGESVTGEKGVTFEFEADSNVPGYTYNGAIPLTDGDEPAIS